MGDHKKLLMLDVDGTLAPHGEPVSKPVAQGLCELKRRGHVIGFASGKSEAYIEGLARGIGLEDVPIIAENGSVLATPDPVMLVERPAFFDRLQSEIALLFPDVYMQHNHVNLTVMAKGAALQAAAAHIREAGCGDGKGCSVYMHSDSVELLPRHVSKGRALSELKRRRGWETADIIAAGNAANDLPMRDEAGLFLAVGGEIEADRNFGNAEKLIEYLLDVCE